MRELTLKEISQVGGGGVVADSLGIIGHNFFNFAGAIGDQIIAGIPGVSSVTGVLSLFGISIGSVSGAIGEGLGYTIGRTSEAIYETISELCYGGEA